MAGNNRKGFVMARYLVTGGGGFIGSNIAEALCNRGQTVRVLDDFSTGNRDNLASLSERIELIEGSVTDLETCRKAAEGVDYALHQAAVPSVPRSVAEPVRTHEVNATGVLNMLVASRDADVKRFVFAASSAAYGDAERLPKIEDMPPSPLSPYAAQKIAGEMYCRLFFTLYGLETVALRYFNVFGPRQDPNSEYAAVIPKFIRAVMEGRRPMIFDDGEQSRDFTFVENVVEANLLACLAGPDAAGEVINVACGERVTLNEVADAVQDVLGTHTGVDYGDPRPGDIKHSLADIGKARRLLGYNPKVGFREGLERTAAWYARGAC